MKRKLWNFCGKTVLCAVCCAIMLSVPVSAAPVPDEGDLNADGYVNTTDVVLLRRHIAGGYEVEADEYASDLNADGYVNTSDVVLLRRYIADGYDVVLKPVSGYYTQETVCEMPSLTAYPRFAEMAQASFLVPGLRQGLIPQGMDAWEERDAVLISAYSDDPNEASVLLAVQVSTGRLIGEYRLKNSDGSDYTGHAGGVAVTSKNVFISEGGCLYRIPLNALEKSGEVTFAEEIAVPVRASFCNVSGGILWTGDFYYGTSYPTDDFRHMVNRDGKTYCAWAVGYVLEDTDREIQKDAITAGAFATPDCVLSVADRIQGMVYVKDAGQIVLSQSYGRKNNSTLYVYRDPMQGTPHAQVTLNGVSVPVWFLDSGELVGKIPALPMSEGMAYMKNKLFVLFESGAEKYRGDGKLPTDRVWTIDLTK